MDQPVVLLTLVWFAGFALEHHNLPWATGDLHALRTQTSGLLQATVDSPLITEPGDILAGGFARLT